MFIMPATAVQVLVHVMGLTVFSTQIPGDPGLKVIIPKVVYVDPWSARTTSATKVNPPLKHVEDHKAVIAFETATLDATSTWGPVKPLRDTNGDWSYVELTNDYVRFDLGGYINNSTQRSTTSKVAAAAGLKLPHLTSLCSGDAHLKPIYLPITHYSGAAGVIDIPPGTAQACQTKYAGRVDAESALTASGSFTLYAGSGSSLKKLRLKPAGSATKLNVIVANVPVSCLNSGCAMPNPNAIDGLPHTVALYNMGADDTSACNTPLKSWWDSLAEADKPGNCMIPDIPAALGGQGGMTLMKNNRVAYNFECSDTQWP